MSTPAPPASLLFRLSGFALYTLSTVVMAILVLSGVLLILHSIDWQAVSGPLVLLVLMLGFLYWTTTLLPGPVRKLGKATGRGVVRAMRKRERK